MIEQWQELKETITEMRDNDGTGTQQETCKFLVNYMEILEKQMQQSCEDCISRQAVIDAINFEDEWLFDAKSHNADTKIAFSSLESRVKALPPVTPERPKGKWIEIEIDAGEFIYKCTKCGMRVINPYKYCPNCGSDNGGEEDG